MDSKTLHVQNYLILYEEGFVLLLLFPFTDEETEL